jgi:hypothetical protein
MVLAVYRPMDGHNLIYGLSNLRLIGNAITCTGLRLIDGHNHIYGFGILRLIDGHNHIYGLSDLSSHGRP